MKKEKKHNQQIPYMVVIGIVAIVAIVSLVLYGNAGVEGAVIGEEVVGGYEKACVDDDSANDYYVAGKVKQGPIEYLDHCRGDMLYQYSCFPSNNPEFTRPYNCPRGCVNGVCLR